MHTSGSRSSYLRLDSHPRLGNYITNIFRLSAAAAAFDIFPSSTSNWAQEINRIGNRNTPCCCWVSQSQRTSSSPVGVAGPLFQQLINTVVLSPIASGDSLRSARQHLVTSCKRYGGRSDESVFFSLYFSCRSLPFVVGRVSPHKLDVINC